MKLQIRNPRARALAVELARRKNVSMTQAVIAALTSELQRINDTGQLAERLGLIAGDLAALANRVEMR